MFEEKKSVKEIIEEMRKELKKTGKEKTDPFEQLMGKKKIELANIKNKKHRKAKIARAKAKKPKKKKHTPKKQKKNKRRK